ARRVGQRFVEEFGRGRVRPDPVADRTQKAAQRASDGLVVVDHVNDGLLSHDASRFTVRIGSVSGPPGSRTSATRSLGIENLTVSPWSLFLSAQMRPRWDVTILLQIDSPNPRPSFFVVWSGANMRSSRSGSAPSPASLNATVISSSVAQAETRS